MNGDAHRHCLDCGYILDGLPEDRCSECGRVFDPADSSTFVVDQPLGHPIRRGTPYLIAALVGFGMIACSMLAYNSTDSLYSPRRAIFLEQLHFSGVGVEIAVLCVGAVAFLFRPSGRGDRFYAALKIAGTVVVVYFGFFLLLWVLWSR